MQIYSQSLSLFPVTIYYPTSSCAKTYRQGRSDPRHHRNIIRTCLPLNLAAYSPEFGEVFERANLPNTELNIVQYLKTRVSTSQRFSLWFRSVLKKYDTRSLINILYCISLLSNGKKYERGLPVLGFIVK